MHAPDHEDSIIFIISQSSIYQILVMIQGKVNIILELCYISKYFELYMKRK